MARLNNRAFKILLAELQNCVGDDAISKLEEEIVLERFKKLRSQPGTPASLDELRDTVFDVFPQFSEKALKSAARANRSPGLLTKLKWTVGIVSTATGVIWIVNLPYPMVRLPVAKAAPLLLLPSYISMDYHYRQAIALVEQADQLVNNATSAADFELGSQKVNQAQQHLDALPVWFLGYSPQYTFWFGWQFTFDEFQTARANVGRMTAIVFQQNNAQNLLTQGEQQINSAKQQLSQASTPTDKQSAIASWSSALDQLEQIPSETLAGKTAQKKLEAYKRDYQEIVGLAAGNERISTLIAAAKQFSMQAAVASQNPPHSVSQWQQIEDLWQEAIVRLQQIPAEDLAGYAVAQKSLAEYQANLGQIKIRKQYEADSVAALEQAQSAIQNLIASTPTDAKLLDRNRTISEMQGIINQLEKVKPGTTSYLKAQELLLSAQNKLKQLQS